MTTTGRRFIIVALLLALLAPALPVHLTPVLAQEDEGAIFFPETGFWVDEEFAEFWRKQGGLMVFGYPVSRVFYQDGLHRQYFERAIFEHHEDESPPYNVLLVRMGSLNTIDARRELAGPFAPAVWPAGDRQWFPETRHTLSGIFQEYWEENGGLQTFGFPISEPHLELSLYDGVHRTVQYFERARLEHHPDKAGTEFEILLGHLGVEALGQRTVPELAVTPQRDIPRHRESPPLPPIPLFDTPPVPCGFNFAFWGDMANDMNNGLYLDRMVDTGCAWVRMQFNWSDLEPFDGASIDSRLPAYRRVVSDANQRGLQILVNVNDAPLWAQTNDPNAPADPDAFANFMGQLASRFAGQVDAWQIWNEPNLIDEGHIEVRPEGYLAMVRKVSPAIRDADPDALIVSPGLGPTGLMYDDWALDDAWYLEYLLGLNNGEIIDYFDVFAMHAYGAGNSPDNYWPSNPAENPGWVDGPEFYFRRAEELKRIMEFAGIGDKPIWITETGWTTPNTNPMYGYGEWVTPDLQAEYVTRAMEIIRTEWDWVDQVFIWHFNAAPYAGIGGPYSGFSMYTAAGTPRPVLLAFQEWLAQWDDSR